MHKCPPPISNNILHTFVYSMSHTSLFVGTGYVRETCLVQTHWEACTFFTRNFYIKLPSFFHENAFSSFLVDFYRNHATIDDFRGACAVKGNVQVAGHIKRVNHGDAFNEWRYETLTGHYFILKFDLSWRFRTKMKKNWRNISQFTMWLSQSSIYIYKTYQSLYQFQHFAAKCDSAMDKWSLPQ